MIARRMSRALALVFGVVMLAGCDNDWVSWDYEEPPPPATIPPQPATCDGCVGGAIPLYVGNCASIELEGYHHSEGGDTGDTTLSAIDAQRSDDPTIASLRVSTSTWTASQLTGAATIADHSSAPVYVVCGVAPGVTNIEVTYSSTPYQIGVHVYAQP